MTVKSYIRQALKQIMTEGEANACDIWKGYDIGTGQAGWHYVPFGRTATYLGKSKAEAMEFIEQVLDYRESVK